MVRLNSHSFHYNSSLPNLILGNNSSQYVFKITTYITDIQFDQYDITLRDLTKFVTKYFCYHNHVPINTICDYQNDSDQFDAFSVMLTP